ncbi:MAG: tRNA threonylcarbamoyladenosine dehydratase [Candidatus Accumulibacter sp.]|jgi:tRNA A37 threonylcarbamoyladenosine dehydratase|nr:tRNA threonylcarbamoyladenosine dehydratase [Accumulibacter sp.]
MSAASLGDEAPDFERRFGGVRRLYGDGALRRFQAARVGIVGIGGVGSWVAEALARSAIGNITLIDLDMLAESNVNRQIHAIDGVFGKSKTEVMAERIRAINPACRVESVEDFVTPENAAALIGGDFDFIIDAIDQARAKAAIIAYCVRNGRSFVTAGGAGGRIDPARIGTADLSRTAQDALLARVRSLLRREYGFARDPKKKLGVPAVFSTEPMRPREREDACEPRAAPVGLSCAGYGSSVCVTATFGFCAASLTLNHIAQTGTRF